MKYFLARSHGIRDSSIHANEDLHGSLHGLYEQVDPEAIAESSDKPTWINLPDHSMYQGLVFGGRTHEELVTVAQKCAHTHAGKTVEKL